MAATPEATSVYIVEGSATVSHCLRGLLTQLPNVTVLGASSHQHHAIDSIRLLRPAVVTLDVRLADGNGLAVLQAIKRQPLPPTVIALGCSTDPHADRRWRQLGADFFFDKALDFPRMLELIRGFSSRHPRDCGD